MRCKLKKKTPKTLSAIAKREKKTVYTANQITRKEKSEMNTATNLLPSRNIKITLELKRINSQKL